MSRRAKLAAGDACPRCGVEDLKAPCVGSAAHGSRPLPYRHAGRKPATQASLMPPPAPPPAGSQATAAQVPPEPYQGDEGRRFPVPPCLECGSLDTIEHDGNGGTPTASYGNTVTCDTCGAEATAARWIFAWGGSDEVRRLREKAERDGARYLPTPG